MDRESWQATVHGAAKSQTQVSANTPSEKHVLYGCSRLFPCPRILTEQGLSAGLRGHATCPCWTLLSFPRGAGESPEHVSPRVTQEAPVLRVCCLTWWRQGLEHGGAAVDLEATGPSEGSQRRRQVCAFVDPRWQHSNLPFLFVQLTAL